MILTATLGTERRLPDEYVVYRLCREFGWTPDQIEAMDAHTVDLFISFMNTEARAEHLRRAREEFNRK